MVLVTGAPFATKGGVALAFFDGTGTTLIAAKQSRQQGVDINLSLDNLELVDNLRCNRISVASFSDR